MLSREVLTVAALMLAVAAGPAGAQPASLVGSWEGQVNFNGLSVTLDLMLQADGHFSEQESSMYGTTMQTGSYFLGNGTLSLQVEDYEPKQHMVYHGTGTTGGYTTMEAVPPPPGGTYSVQILSADSIVLQDYNGAVQFYRME